MKKLLVMVIALLCAVSVLGAPAFSEVKASILRYEPTPASQGSTLDVWVQLSNPGTKAERGEVKFNAEYPFSLPGGQPERVDVGTIAATEDKVVKFTVFVDPNAPNGERSIKFLYKFGVTQDWIQLESPITIQSQDAGIVIESFKVLPIVPGQPAEVTMSLRNDGRIGVKNVDVRLDLSAETFSTIGTGAKKRIAHIPGGESETVTFMLQSDTSTDVKVHQIPVVLEFEDDRGNRYNDSSKISVMVNAKPELSMAIDGVDFADKRAAGTVSLKVINKGIVDVKYVTVRLAETDEYDVLSPSNEAYVGNLDNDDFETVDFIIKPGVDSPKLRVILEFKNPYNEPIAQEYVLPLRIITDADLGKGGFPFGTIIVLLLLGVGAWWYWKKRKSKKR